MPTISPHHQISLNLADLARRQHGVVAARQLAALGCSRSMMSCWAKAGRLHRVHHGTYAVGHRAITLDGHRTAAVLAAGPDAAASHRSAAGVADLLHDPGRVTHVSVPASRGARSRPGIVVHRPRTLAPEEVTTVRGIPVTTIARTLADLGDVVGASLVRSAFVAAERRELLDMDAVAAQLVRAPFQRGPRILAEVVRAYDPRWAATRSDLELATLDLLGAGGLPPAEVNVWIDDRYVADLLWRDRGLIVEIDSRRFHASPGARRADAHRDRELRLLGFTVVRVSDTDIESRPHLVADRVSRALLGRPARRGPSARPQAG